ncbi:lipopolysaccharide assembly protein LapA domain-containing protein [Arenibaculum pallidiluteum]|uniref:lipopolysaccharide assembly protein LapA domain-containing protein n=1 Tax=Arenibaculum pallidiluteum TaxID=2812559 RepID=UPI001A95E0BA|nr:lipopolysaccharide assembly protein LapA domain-containing protein [Arenibaculum pallidiluteum]
MRILSWLVAIPVALVAISFALSNRDLVTLSLWPLPFTLDLPVYLVGLAGILVGFVAGGLVAWLGQHGSRSAARRERRRAERLAGELEAARKARADADRRLNEAARQVSQATALLPHDPAARGERLRLAAR